ncbi:MAG: thymidine phosphorylase [Thermoanaerobaculia bacterium]|nr:thymidine phosphorylase [Thermoanaerobaculia bacterium]
MADSPYRILHRKRRGRSLTAEEIGDVVRGAVDGGWSEGQLAAFLMAAAIRGLDPSETRALTLAMLDSGDRWELARDVPRVGDKHSTGGVGDKVSLILSPLLAACGQPVVMLTGRGLGHTGGTADKLETIPGLDLGLDRDDCVRLLGSVGMAVGIATGSIAPADRRLYALRDQTATVESIPLITASILSKKLASGAAAVAYDVKTGEGAFLSDPAEAETLARSLVEISEPLGQRASALITDMSQPLGEWVGHAAEVRETLDCLEGRGEPRLMEVVLALCEEVARLTGGTVHRDDLERAVSSGAARELFDRWVEAQGGDLRRLPRASRELAPVEAVATAPAAGSLHRVETRRLGLLLAEAGGGRTRPGGEIDPAVSIRVRARLGDRLAPGDELARLYLRRPDERIAAEFRSCFHLAAEPCEAPPLVRARISG